MLSTTGFTIAATRRRLARTLPSRTRSGGCARALRIGADADRQTPRGVAATSTCPRDVEAMLSHGFSFGARRIARGCHSEDRGRAFVDAASRAVSCGEPRISDSVAARSAGFKLPVRHASAYSRGVIPSARLNVLSSWCCPMPPRPSPACRARCPRRLHWRSARKSDARGVTAGDAAGDRSGWQRLHARNPAPPLRARRREKTVTRSRPVFGSGTSAGSRPASRRPRRRTHRPIAHPVVTARHSAFRRACLHDTPAIPAAIRLLTSKCAVRGPLRSPSRSPRSAVPVRRRGP